MRLAWKIFRAIISTLLLLAVVLPVSLYVLLSVDPVQKTISEVAERELSSLLGAEVAIGEINIHPFNRLAVSDMSLTLDSAEVARINTVSAGFELFHFIRTGELVIDYALVDGATFSLWRESAGADLNITPILRRLRSDRPSQEKAFDLRINTVVLRNASLAYDVLDAPTREPGSFDPAHISISDFELNAYIPRISNSRYSVELDHLSFRERCGFELSTLRAKADVDEHVATLSNFTVELPASRLSLSPVTLTYPSLSRIAEGLRQSQLTLSTSSPAAVTPADFKAFAPVLAEIPHTFALDFDICGNMEHADVRSLAVRDISGGSFALLLSATADTLAQPKSLNYDIDRLSVHFNGPEIASLTRRMLPRQALDIISRMPDLTLGVEGKGSLSKGAIALNIMGSPGDIKGDVTYSKSGSYLSAKGGLELEEFRLDLLTGNSTFGELSAKIEGEVRTGRSLIADVSLEVEKAVVKGYTYTDLTANFKADADKRREFSLSLDDPNAKLLAYVLYGDEGGMHSLQSTLTASEIDLEALGLSNTFSGKRLAAKLNMAVDGSCLSDVSGYAQLFDVRWVDKAGKGLRINNIRAEAHPEYPISELTLSSDFLNGSLRGDYDFGALPAQLRDMVADFLPAICPRDAKKKVPEGVNDFSFDFTLASCPELTSFFKLPVHTLYDVNIDGRVDSRARKAFASIEAPYLRQGNKLLENTDVFVVIDKEHDNNSIYATSQFPTKKGDMAVTALIGMLDNKLDTKIDWSIERAIPLNGTVGFTTELRSVGKQAGATFPLDALVEFLPGTVNFGDEVWRITPSQIDVTPNRLDVAGFGLTAGTQSIAINGTIGKSEADSLTVSLNTVALLPIFDTLEIDKALIGGRATGVFTAKDIFSAEPFLRCPRLHVDSIGYQRCTIGDADILAEWNNSHKSFYLDADITGLEGRKSRIYGDIFPFTEALDINFDADSVPVGFLKPFMEAFTSDISGRASGKCRLFGTFKEIDLEGDIKADNVKLKIDFTGTSYTATDSVHLRPGSIVLRNLTIRDSEGHTALLNGNVGHKFFKEPTFRFDITDARDFLSYNITAKDNPDWYGTIYGNGGVSISGYPGVVNINVAMSTAPRSKFTFVLNDRLDAEDYTFLTFRDVTPDSLKPASTVRDDTPAAVRAFRSGNTGEAESPSAYNMDIRVDVTKDAAMTLVMDPVGGDEIKATGEGNLHMVYRSTNNDLNIWGKYTVAEGSYRFTLQDIIIKDFTIREGSMIQFDGDPYGVKTSLEAFYATNANLSDLDESFLQDKEVARTKVPVHALMKVTGDIRQPSIDFDLEFPTLTSDTYRKVRSIVSTSDMMNRQIIYLLALNRFYTPDYMSSTTKGSELVSVASSTISSQLGNILGKLSDKWSIAPNFRSDKGDFSDVEVDVALSSRLLNNRLIFNGNFGYRDKTLNTNQFIGDFDIEYLLNKRGTWRLKAYNRYNDRNYYVRTAQTTQGVGIMFRRDFDKLFNFLRPKKKEESDTTDIKTPANPEK